MSLSTSNPDHQARNPVTGVRGMNDLLPHETEIWQFMEQGFRLVLQNHGYQEIRLPLIERTELFQHSIGDSTDIVQKEMYTFADRNDESLTLRPEGTAGVMRAVIEHGLFHQPQRLWYMGPMFRYERPQKGRYRQFHQFGVELLGYQGVEADAEIIAISARLWRFLGIDDLKLQLNMLGSEKSRFRYRQVLQTYLRQHAHRLDEVSKLRLDTNPLRILDSKNPEVRAVLEEAPLLDDFLSEEDKLRCSHLCTLLDDMGIDYHKNSRLVRGLDYYDGAVFEWVTTRLGAQNAVCAGGRYDGLAEKIGGSATPAAGFAIGLERLVALLETLNQLPTTSHLHAYLLYTSDQWTSAAFTLAESLRDKLPQLRMMVHCGGGSMKSRLRRADKSKAECALIIGEEELRDSRVQIKHMRSNAETLLIHRDQLAAWLQEHFRL